MISPYVLISLIEVRKITEDQGVRDSPLSAHTSRYNNSFCSPCALSSAVPISLSQSGPPLLNYTTSDPMSAGVLFLESELDRLYDRYSGAKSRHNITEDAMRIVWSTAAKYQNSRCTPSQDGSGGSHMNTAARLQGLSFVMLGPFRFFSEADGETIAQSHGGSVDQVLTAATSYVVRGTYFSASDSARATELNVRVIEDYQFLALVAGIGDITLRGMTRDLQEPTVTHSEAFRSKMPIKQPKIRDRVHIKVPRAAKRGISQIDKFLARVAGSEMVFMERLSRLESDSAASGQSYYGGELHRKSLGDRRSHVDKVINPSKRVRKRHANSFRRAGNRLR